MHAHNDLLELAAESGLPAATLYLSALLAGMGGALFLAFTAATQEKRILAWTFAALCIAFFVDGLFGFNLHRPVSASLLFISLGALENLLIRGRPLRAPRWASPVPGMLPWAACALGLAFASVETRAFAAEMSLAKGLRARALHDPAAYGFFEKASTLMPWDYRPLYKHGVARLYAGDPQEAKALLTAALDRNPTWLMARVSLAHAELEQAKALAADPENQAKHLDAAEEDARQVVALCDVMPNAEDILGRALSLRAVSAGEGEAAKLWHEARGRFIRALAYGCENAAKVYLMLGRGVAPTGRR
jgi:tetratricopeptide (TPR) repeat protein